MIQVFLTLCGIVFVPLIELFILKFFFKTKSSTSHFILFLIFLLMIFFILIPFYFYKINPPNDEFIKFNAFTFTILGAVFTTINTIVVIYLMVWLHYKETNFNLLSYFDKNHKSLIEIKKRLETELNFFEDSNYQLIRNLEEENEYNNFNLITLYKDELNNVNEIIKKYKKTMQQYDIWKNKVLAKDLDILECQKLMSLINKFEELLSTNSPSQSYKSGFNNGYQDDILPEEMIAAAKSKAINSINDFIKIMEEIS